MQASEAELVEIFNGFIRLHWTFRGPQCPVLLPAYLRSVLLSAGQSALESYLFEAKNIQY